MSDPTLPVRLFQIISSGQFDAIDGLLHPEFVTHGPAGQQQDAAGLLAMLAAFHTGFPDMNVSALDVITEGDRCAWRVDGEGTHTGEFMGVPATGRRVRFTGVDLAVVVDGRLFEHWSGEDLAGVLIQIGAIPVPTPV
jgi:predicted ester cyclase